MGRRAEIEEKEMRRSLRIPEKPEPDTQRTLLFSEEEGGGEEENRFFAASFSRRRSRRRDGLRL
jgi:hypothetical protein